MKNKTYIIAMTGASGSLYGVRLIKAILNAKVNLIVIVSNAAIKVLEHETKYKKENSFKDFVISHGVKEQYKANIKVFFQDQIDSSCASGSFVHSGMVIAPCSMKTLASVSAGFADNLITRTADVTLKEKRTLVIVPRETPYNLIHLENMIKLCRAGAIILPPNPLFYTFPRTIEDLIDTTIARILDHLKIDHNLCKRWKT